MTKQKNSLQKHKIFVNLIRCKSALKKKVLKKIKINAFFG